MYISSCLFFNLLFSVIHVCISVFICSFVCTCKNSVNEQIHSSYAKKVTKSLMSVVSFFAGSYTVPLQMRLSSECNGSITMRTSHISSQHVDDVLRDLLYVQVH